MINEGELKKRMDVGVRKFLTSEGDVLSGITDLVWREFYGLIDEAKKDFPVCTVGIDVNHPMIIEEYAKYVNEVITFREKWFGDYNG